jgi:hypothetical protein
MTEQRLKVESGPPEHVVSDARDRADAPPHEEQSAAAGAKDKAQEAATDAKAKVQEAAAPAKEKARGIAGQAKGHAQAAAQAAAEQAKGRAAAQVDERSTQVGQQIGTQAQSLDGVAEELRRQGNDGPAKLAEQAGERVKRVGSYLEQADGESLVHAVADAARENPAAAAAAGAAAGFAAGRLLKASRAGDDSGEEDEAARPGQAS